MYSFHVLVESGVLQAIVKLKSRMGQWSSAWECVGVSNLLYVVYTIYDLAPFHWKVLVRTLHYKFGKDSTSFIIIN